MTQTTQTPCFYLIAGEASGDNIGAGLMAALKERYGPQVEIYGIGGPRMQAQGLQSLFDYSELAIMGFVEVIKHLPRVLARMKQTLEHIKTHTPSVLITIDSPGFNKRLVKKLKAELGADCPPLVHVVAPTVWAYKPKRAKQFAKLFDHLLVILPFEPPYFEAEGLPCHYIGHPSAWEWQHAKADVAAFKAQHQIADTDMCVGVLPGSRAGEIAFHWPVFRETIARVAKEIPSLKTIMPLPAHLRPALEDRLKAWPTPLVLVDPVTEKHAAFKAMHGALAKSGTVTLELALAGVPMIVSHKVTAFSAWLIRRMLLIKYYSLVNILGDAEILPEYMQEECTPEVLAPALKKHLLDEATRNAQKENAHLALHTLEMNDGLSPAQHAVRVIETILR